jgi:hypothetical protein
MISPLVFYRDIPIDAILFSNFFTVRATLPPDLPAAPPSFIMAKLLATAKWWINFLVNAWTTFSRLVDVSVVGY